MKYQIYLRVSTDEQEEEMQLDHIMKFIQQRSPGGFQYNVYRDKVSSKKPLFKRIPEGDGEKTIVPRVAAKAMMESLEKGDIIVSMRLDRLARNVYETTQLIDILEKREVELLIVTQPGIKNKIMLGVYAGMAEEEVKTIRARISEKMESKKMHGQRRSRYLPYGYALHETKLIPIRNGTKVTMKRGILIPLFEEQQIISKIYSLSDQGYSVPKIVKTLTEAGHRNREGKEFQRISIHRLLAQREDSTLQDQAPNQLLSLASH